MSTGPIIKRCGTFVFELIDFFEIYSHVPCAAPRLGKSKILHCNNLENTITAQSVRSMEVNSFPVRQVKLYLKDISKLRSSDIKIIACLALNVDAFSGSSTSISNGYLITSDEYQLEIKFTNPDISIKTFKQGKPVETKNIGLIISYLIKNGYDLYGLIGKTYALSTNRITLI